MESYVGFGVKGDKEEKKIIISFQMRKAKGLIYSLQQDSRREEKERRIHGVLLANTYTEILSALNDIIELTDITGA